MKGGKESKGEESIELSVNAADMAGGLDIDADEQPEMSTEKKIEEQIIEQAKAFAD
jgi:hypothetical protein